MKTNKDLGYETIAQVGTGEYSVGQRGEKYRAYGYEWHGEQDASREFGHHHVCGRGDTADEAIDLMIDTAIISGRVSEGGCLGLTSDEAETLRAGLHEAVAELADAE